MEDGRDSALTVSPSSLPRHDALGQAQQCYWIIYPTLKIADFEDIFFSYVYLIYD